MAITRLGPNQSVNLASNVTGTLPAANVANSTLNNVTALPAAIVTGKVLQVVNAHTGTQVTSNSATYADTTLTASITPSATSSKILVLVQQSFGKSGANTYGNIRVYRDSTEIGGAVPARSIGYDQETGANYIGIGLAYSYQDSPSSTSALVYKTQFNNDQATGTTKVQTDSGQSYMTLMEIAG